MLLPSPYFFIGPIISQTTEQIAKKSGNFQNFTHTFRPFLPWVLQEVTEKCARFGLDCRLQSPLSHSDFEMEQTRLKSPKHCEHRWLDYRLSFSNLVQFKPRNWYLALIRDAAKSIIFHICRSTITLKYILEFETAWKMGRAKSMHY